jgi:hypothetical protein
MKRRKSIYAPEQELSLDTFLPARSETGDPMKIEIAAPRRDLAVV